MNKKYLEYVGLAIVILAAAYFLLPPKEATYGSATGYDSLNLTPSASTGDSYALAIGGVPAIDMLGVFPQVIVGTSTNTAMTHYNCATTTWNPSAAGSSTDVTIDLFVPGYVIGDSIVASLATNTQGLALTAVSTSSLTGTTTAVLYDTDNTGALIDITTTTVKICDLN